MAALAPLPLSNVEALISLRTGALAGVLPEAVPLRWHKSPQVSSSSLIRWLTSTVWPLASHKYS
jgi:hypothetical protein